MENMRTRFIIAVTGRLSAAADSTAKVELIEELSENLYSRWQDLVNQGMDGNQAYDKAMEDLGSVEELLAYLDSLGPEGELPRQEAELLLGFCDNCGPAFLLGYVGAGVLGDARAGAYLYLIHVLSALLAGMVLSLLGQGAPALEAAACAVWLHGRAGDLCAEELSEYAMTPMDLIGRLPAVFKELGF